MIHFKGTPLEIEKMIRQTAMLDGFIKIYMEQEGGGSGVNAIDYYQRKILVGFDFHPDLKKANKEIRADPVADAVS